jgi:single-strand DNA-binding protein
MKGSQVGCQKGIVMSNHLTLTGNVVREIELKFTASGNARLVMPVATNRRFQAKGSDTPTEVTSFFTVIVWGSLAEHVAESVKKGDRVTVSGRVEQRTWFDAAEQRHNSFEIVADEVAVSLRFRTVKVDRPARETPDVVASEFEPEIQTDAQISAHQEDEPEAEESFAMAG